MREFYWLTVYQADTGCATHVAGAYGIDGDERWVQWIPIDDGATRWRAELARLSLDLSSPLVSSQDLQPIVNNISFGLISADPVGDARPVGVVVEEMVDAALAVGI